MRLVPKVMNMSIGWEPPNAGWLKINIDGSSAGNPGLAACGWVIRNGLGRWGGWFFCKHGKLYNFSGGIMGGVLHGLQTIWELGCRRVILESDSKAVIDSIVRRNGKSSHLNSFIRNIKLWLSKDWQVRIRHVFREGNKATDWLAREGLEQEMGYYFIDLPQTSLRMILDDDCRGVLVPQSIRTL
ncbi:Putative ribonuclease H protein [Arachis hypogaea]|nr:Putative ribonuclease H protein [Arachis hypogaea]